jgi:hypothetical protein
MAEPDRYEHPGDYDADPSPLDTATKAAWALLHRLDAAVDRGGGLTRAELATAGGELARITAGFDQLREEFERRLATVPLLPEDAL